MDREEALIRFQKLMDEEVAEVATLKEIYSTKLEK